jgi:hypothetical protein
MNIKSILALCSMPILFICSDGFTQNSPDTTQSALNRIEIYKAQALKDIQAEEYHRACELLSTSLKLAKFHSIELQSNLSDLESHKKFACTKRDIRATEELSKMNKTLEALHPFLDTLIGCDSIKEQCLNTSNYNACMKLKGSSCSK